ncbi:MAG: hypothetical protein ACK4FA_00350 [Candidatus Paceibacteria bacterium]
MNRLDLLYPIRPTKNNPNPRMVTLDTLENQHQNFFLIGVDAKNPWGGQSHKLGPNDVLNLTRSGINIRANPHIGLHWPSNSMYPFMGVQICDYMGNMSIVDTADEPQNIKENGVTHHCAVQTEPVLSPYLKVNSSIIQSNGYLSAKNFGHKINLGHVHHEAKRLALGQENVMLDADLLTFPWVHDFFQIIIENEFFILQGYDQRKGIFDRHISTEGVLTRIDSPGKLRDVEHFLVMKSQHAEMIRNDCLLPATGFFPIKEAVILLDSLVCYWQQKEQNLEHEGIGDTYTMSGIDMINYTKSQPLRCVLDRMYKSLLKSGKFGWLPKYMGHSILPGGTFRFLPCNAEQDLLESVLKLVDLHKQRAKLNSELASVGDDQNERARLVIWSREIINPGFVIERKNFRRLLSERRGFSQFDLLNGDFVPKEVVEPLMSLSFEQINNLVKFEDKDEQAA